jgi:RNA polymerase sigma-70 factor (sigma-E family)
MFGRAGASYKTEGSDGGNGVDREQLCRELLPSSLAFARVLTSDRGLAEDLVQDVLLKVCAKPDRVAAAADRHAYVRRMIVNEFVSWGRRWFRVVPVIEVPQTDVVDHSARVADRQVLRAELAALPPRQRAVLVLRYYGGLSDAEIATELGCSISTVRSHASRALAAVRIDLGGPTRPKTKVVT